MDQCKVQRYQRSYVCLTVSVGSDIEVKITNQKSCQKTAHSLHNFWVIQCLCARTRIMSAASLRRLMYCASLFSHSQMSQARGEKGVRAVNILMNLSDVLYFEQGHNHTFYDGFYRWGRQHLITYYNHRCIPLLKHTSKFAILNKRWPYFQRGSGTLWEISFCTLLLTFPP